MNLSLTKEEATYLLKKMHAATTCDPRLAGIYSKIDLQRELGGDMLKVEIEVSGGVAECTSCPKGVEVEIIDHDDIEAAEGAMKCMECHQTVNALRAGLCRACSPDPDAWPKEVL